MNNIKIVHYDIIDVSKDIIVYKTSSFEKCDICHYWYFLDKEFKFQPETAMCFILLMMSMKLSNIAILNVHGVNYCCIICGISKSEAMNLMQNTDLTKTSGTL